MHDESDKYVFSSTVIKIQYNRFLAKVSSMEINKYIILGKVYEPLYGHAELHTFIIFLTVLKLYSDQYDIKKLGYIFHLLVILHNTTSWLISST